MNQAGQPAWREIPGGNTDNFTHFKINVEHDSVYLSNF